MLYCDKCRLSVAGHRDRCPLCQGALSGESGPETFPVIPTGRHQYHLVLRMLIFLSITAVVVSGAINVMSVSYTHLDVYKRQTWQCAFMKPGARYRPARSVSAGPL